MRYRNPMQGDVRVRRIFLLFPRTCRNQTRWLEWATIREKYSYGRHGGGWCIDAFIDPKE